MNLDAIDWLALERLRNAFLEGTAGQADYWQSESNLASYDATFAQRIGWKWDYVLAELTRRSWTPPRGELFDWGCGSGIAHRAFLDHFGVESVVGVGMWDRSPLAMEFAAKRARMKYPGLAVCSRALSPHPDPFPRGEGTAVVPLVSSNPSTASAGVPDSGRMASHDTDASSSPGGEDRGEGGTESFTLLISHVLSELDPKQSDQLVELAAQASAVIWVEPGNYESSLALIAVRERLRGQRKVVAPCTHAERCGILAPGNERHWCHHFASPPPEVFMDANWARFAKLVGVDLRSLPLSFLVLDQRLVPALPDGATRMIGSPRVQKPHALLLACDASGVAERRITRRRLPEEYRACKRGEFDVLHAWDCKGDEVLATRPLYAPSTTGGASAATPRSSS